MPILSLLDLTISHIFSNLILVIAVVSVVLMGAAELGCRSGARLYRDKDEVRKGQLPGVQGAVLGLMGLLLGFTFAIAAGRFETRRGLVLAEANGIGTAYAHAEFLPEAEQRSVENLLRRYVDARLVYFSARRDVTAAELQAAEQQGWQIQRELWTLAVAAGRQNPTPVIAGFVSAVNDLSTLDTARINARRAQVPGAVWLLLLVVAVCGCAVSGYGTGAGGRRSAITQVMLPGLIAVVITLVADLDSPKSGLISVSQQAMVDLQHSIQPRQP